jgi:hypothetical protein
VRARQPHEPFIMPAGGCKPLITALARAAGVRLRRHYEVRDTGSISAMVLPAARALMRLAEDRVRSAVGADDQAL